MRLEGLTTPSTQRRRSVQCAAARCDERFDDRKFVSIASLCISSFLLLSIGLYPCICLSLHANVTPVNVVAFSVCQTPQLAG